MDEYDEIIEDEPGACFNVGFYRADGNFCHQLMCPVSREEAEYYVAALNAQSGKPFPNKKGYYPQYNARVVPYDPIKAAETW